MYDGADGSQIAFWTYGQTARSKEHSHEFDEYVVVIQGQYTIFTSNKKILLHPGDEHVIPKTVGHSGEAIAGTRAFYAFGGKRAEREIRNP